MAATLPKSADTKTESEEGNQGAGASQRIRGQLPAHIDLPKWVTADQIRTLIKELEWNPELDINDKLVEFALELEGSIKVG